jgi:hypothetical protein
MKFNLTEFIKHIPGWHTNRKIIVFESDDWGSLRMPSRKALNSLLKAGLEVGGSRYNRFDSLESNKDLEGLFEIISGYKDKVGNHPVFTGLCIVANPDFEKIQENNFKEYYYEPFTETLIKNKGHEKVIDLWKEGIENRFFVPQFHGREHLNVQRWLRDLDLGNKHTLIGFQNKLWGINTPLINKDYLAAFDIDSRTDLEYMNIVIKEGLDLFENLLGYRAEYFVPPNGPFNLELLKTLNESGIKYITLNKLQKEPLGDGKYKTRYHFLGKKNSYGQIYLSRNAEFEPSVEGIDWVGKCLRDIDIAFRMRKPSVISTHRVNYTGSLDPGNRTRGLMKLSELFDRILKTWPEVEFLTSKELGDLIRNKTKA